MSIGTLYYMPGSPRSNWLPALIKNLDLDIKVADYSACENFTKEFPLHSTPAYLGSDGFKLTETIAIIDYFVSLVPNSKLFGSNAKERVQILRWLCFLNQDLCGAAINIWLKAKTEEDKKNFTQKLIELLNYIDSELANRKYLALEDQYSVADILGFVFISAISPLIGDVKFDNIATWKKYLIASQPLIAELGKK